MKTTLESRDFSNVHSKGPDFEFCSIEADSMCSGSVYSCNRSKKDILGEFSEDDYKIMKAANQFMVYAYGVDIEIDESVYQEEAEPISEPDVQLNKEILKEKTLKQKEKLLEILKKYNLEDYGKLIATQNVDVDKTSSHGKGDFKPVGETVNELQIMKANGEMPKLVAEGFKKIPDSIKIGALVAAGVGFMSKSMMGSLCIMGASAYAWDKWANSSYDDDKLKSACLDLELSKNWPERKDHSDKPDVMVGEHELFNDLDKPLSYLMKKYLDSESQFSGRDLNQIENDEGEGSVISNVSGPAEMAVHAYMTHLKMPEPPPSVVPSEADLEIQVASQRVFFKVRFNSNMADHKCLFDPGATSSVISRQSLELEERLCGKRFPRLPREAMVKAFGDEVPSMTMEIVLVHIYVEGKLRSKYAPMLVRKEVEKDSQPYDAIIGINLLDGWGVVWGMQDGKTELTFRKNFATGLNLKKIHPRTKSPPPLDRTETKMRVVKGITLESLQTADVLVKLDHEFHQDHGNLVEIQPEVCDLEISSTASVMELKEKQNQFLLRVTNESDQPIYLTEDLDVGEVKVYNDGIRDVAPDLEISASSLDLEYKYKISEIPCSCKFRTDRDAHLIIFNNEFGESSHCKQIINGMHPLEKWKTLPRVVYDEDHIIQILQHKDGSYHFDPRSLRPKLKTRARVILSFREELSIEMRKYLAKFRQLVPDIEICFVRNVSCKGCGSIANRDDERLFSNINGIKIYAIGHKQQPYSLWRVADQDSPVAYFDLGDYVHMQVFKSNYKLFIYLHMIDWHVMHKYRWESTMHLLMTQLNILQVPPTLSILTTYDDMACPEVKQMMRALFLTKPWDGLPMYEPKAEGIAQIKIVNFMLDHCSCKACTAIQNYKPCPVEYFRMLFQGNLGDPKGISKNTRAHVEDLGPTISEIGELMAHVLSSTAELESLPDFGEKQKVFPKDIDIDESHSEDSFENDQNFVGTVPDGDEILHSYHKNVDWRTIIKEESIPEVPDNPKIRKMLIEILDRRTDVFAANEYEWRWLNVPPVVLHWVNEIESVVDKPTSFNPNKGSQLVDKVLRLLELAMVKIVPRSDGSWLQNVCNSYIVPHSSQTKRDMMTGKVGATELTEKSHKASTMRLILDLRNANKNLKNAHQNDFMIDSVDAVMSRLSEAKSLSKLDLTKAYRGLPVHEDSMKSLCFRANYGMLKPFLFSFVSLPDGLSICPAVYQTKIEEALMTELDHAIVYIDDIIIFHDSPEENLKTVDRVLERLQKVNALVSLKKCEFIFKISEFLGFHIEVTPDGVIYGIPQSKLDVFKNMSCPTTRKQLLTYYGMLMFLYKNIPGLQAHVEPLTRHLPTKIPRPFVMTDIQKQAFEKLNKTLDKLPLLHLFSFERTAYLLCDASLTHAGACLAQLNDDGSLRLCMFYSKKFDQPTIYNSTSIDKEITAIMDSVRHFQKYLVHCVKTVIITDLAAMVSMLSSQVEFQNTKVGRQSFKLFNFDFCFQLRHVSSKFGVIQDMLSRIYEQPVTETGLPVSQKADLDEFFNKYKDSIPKEWKEGTIFKYQDMINHLTDVVMNDPTISKTLKSKRLNGLLEQLQPQYMPESIKFAKKQIDSPVYKSQEVEDITSKNSEIKAFAVEYKQDSLIIPSFFNIQIDGYAPPRKVQTLSIAQIIKLQDDDLQCRRAKMYILTTPEHKQDGRIRNHFRVLNGNLLVTRRQQKLPWSDVSNLRVYLTPVAALTVISTLHLIYGHAGKNHLEYYFAASFKCSNRRELVYEVVEGCGPCTLYKWNLQKQAPPGRFAIPEKAAERYHADIVELPAGPINGGTYRHYIGIVDAYSSMMVIYPVRNQTSRTILMAFEHIFSMYPAPTTLCLDNATYFRSEDFIKGMKNLGVLHVQFSTPNKSTTNSPIENRFSTLRKLTLLNKESFGSRSISQVVFASVTQMNVRPIYRLRHLTKDNVPPSAMDLFYGLNPMKYRCPVAKYMQELEPKKQAELRKEQEKILRKYDEEKAIAHETSIKDIRLAEDKLKVGSLVLATNWKRKKHLEKSAHAYRKDLYVVIGIVGQRVTLKPMFSSTKHSFITNVNDVKQLKGHKMLNMLPEDLQRFLGHVDYDDENLLKGKKKPSFFDEKSPTHSDRRLRSGKGIKAGIAKPALEGQTVFSDDESSDEDDMDWAWFFNGGVDPNLKMGPSSEVKEPSPQGQCPTLPPPPPKPQFSNNTFTQSLGAIKMPQELHPHEGAQNLDSPATNFTKGIAEGRINLDRRPPKWPWNNSPRPSYRGPPLAAPKAANTHQFGGGPSFPSPIKNPSGNTIRFQGDSHMRTFSPPKHSFFENMINRKKYDKNVDASVETKGPNQEFANRPGATSSPSVGANRNIQTMDESPIAQREPMVRQNFRKDFDDSSVYEDAKSAIDDQSQSAISEKERSIGALAPDSLLIEFDKMGIANSGERKNIIRKGPTLMLPEAPNLPSKPPTPSNTTDANDGLFSRLHLSDTSITNSKINETTPPAQPNAKNDSNSKELDFAIHPNQRPYSALRRPLDLGASPQLAPPENRDLPRRSDRQTTQTQKLNYKTRGGSNTPSFPKRK